MLCSQEQSKNTQTALQPRATKTARCNRALQMKQCYKQMSNVSADEEGIKCFILSLHPSVKSLVLGVNQSRAFKGKEVGK